MDIQEVSLEVFATLSLSLSLTHTPTHPCRYVCVCVCVCSKNKDERFEIASVHWNRCVESEQIKTFTCTLLADYRGKRSQITELDIEIKLGQGFRQRRQNNKLSWII